MQNKDKTDNRKTGDLAFQARVEYVNIDCEINQSEHNLSLTAV